MGQIHLVLPVISSVYHAEFKHTLGNKSTFPEGDEPMALVILDRKVAKARYKARADEGLRARIGSVEDHLLNAVEIEPSRHRGVVSTRARRGYLVKGNLGALGPAAVRSVGVPFDWCDESLDINIRHIDFALPTFKLNRKPPPHILQSEVLLNPAGRTPDSPVQVGVQRSSPLMGAAEKGLKVA